MTGTLDDDLETLQLRKISPQGERE